MMLEVDGLSVRYGRLTALRGISLKVDEGQIVCIIGPNGAGKSTNEHLLFAARQPSRRLADPLAQSWKQLERPLQIFWTMPPGRRAGRCRSAGSDLLRIANRASLSSITLRRVLARPHRS
jgi:energy-coupling factor transporter ATP-binding protein EcfA2